LVAGVLYRNAGAYAGRILDGLRRHGLDVAGNQPYAIDPAEDTTVPVHGDARGLEAVLLEIRNDGLRTPDAVSAWAERLYPWL
ncbi:TPA: N-formylglutamate amidohydrolase, partial [Pseudomonas aeruginosa]|nr:N-formylglutamate amidohydrolase [Pseudomonas aeruginosa]